MTSLICSNFESESLKIKDERKDSPISFFVKRSLEKYFKDLNGEHKNLYALSLSQLEKPLLEVVIKETKGNYLKRLLFWVSIGSRYERN